MKTKPLLNPKLQVLRSAEETDGTSMSKRDKELKEAAEKGQLRLFDPLLTEMAGERDRHRYTASIEMLDQSPRWVFGNVKRQLDTYLLPLERRFRFRDQELVLQIHPAYVVEGGGKFRHYYPSEREEFVELGLRKLATEGKGILLPDQSGVIFNLYQLQQVLANQGHTYKYSQIREALFILSRSKLHIETLDSKQIVEQGYIERIEIHENETDENSTAVLVRFNDLITKAIQLGSLRLLDYEKTLNLKTAIARAMYKRLAHMYLQANLKEPYRISILRIIEDFGLDTNSPFRTYIPKVEKSLQELVDARILLSFKTLRKWEKKKGTAQKLENVIFELHPSMTLVRDAVQSHAKQTKVPEVSEAKD